MVARGLATSRTRAQALIRAGLVYSGEERLDDVDVPIRDDQVVAVRALDHPYVSRGGIKLAHALDFFAIDAGGATVLDLGASTGGFTDVVLQRGARRVYAVDVGHGQLAQSLREDPRVVSIERTNARRLARDGVPEAVDLIVCDVSFISLTLVLPPALALAAPRAAMVALIKPQFEVGRENVGRGGLVRDTALRREACDRIVAWCDGQPGWRVLGVTPSPIAGGSGNREFLIAARRG